MKTQGNNDITSENSYADAIKRMSGQLKRSDNFKILDKIEKLEHKDSFAPPFPYSDNSKREYNYNK